MKVVTTCQSEALGVPIQEFHGIVKKGVVFDVTEDRFSVLNNNNKYNVPFVVLYIEPDFMNEPVEDAEAAPITVAKSKTRRKKTNGS